MQLIELLYRGFDNLNVFEAHDGCYYDASKGDAQ